jgi:acyl carrier protein
MAVEAEGPADVAAIEPTIAEFWCEVLEVDEVSGDDHLLEMGGNSLAATMIANRIELSLGVRPTMTELLSSSLHELALLCASHAATTEA